MKQSIEGDSQLLFLHLIIQVGCTKLQTKRAGSNPPGLFAYTLCFTGDLLNPTLPAPKLCATYLQPK